MSIWISEFKGQITQGTIVDGVDWGLGDENPLGILISNACDLEHDHSGFLMVAALEVAADVLGSSKEFQSIVKDSTDGQLKKKQYDALIRFLSGYIHNKNICRHFFFDPRPVIDLDSLVVDFQHLKSLNLDSIDGLEPIGQLNHPFVEQMMMRFTSYVARIPVDRPTEEDEKKYIQELAGSYALKS